MNRFAMKLTTFLVAMGLGVMVAWIFLTPSPTLGEPDPNGVPTIAVNEPIDEIIPSISNSIDRPGEPERPEFVEVFTDESRIGRKKKNRVEVRCFERGGEDVAEITFYSRKRDGSWDKRQSFSFARNLAPPCNPEIKDFNNDGLNDLTYWSDSAARGANELRTLFIYDSEIDELVHIKNSNEYPNLEYNGKLNSLTAWHFHGATHTTFLRINGNLLEEFASVGTGDELVVTVLDKRGRSRVISRKKMHQDDIYTRYSTYDPLRP